MILAGTISQLADRIVFKTGVDVFSFSFFREVSFNLADMYIVLGGTYIVLFTIYLDFQKKRGRKLYKVLKREV